MEKLKTKRERLPFLLISLLANLGLLFTFKYFNFAADTAHSIVQKFNIALSIPKLNVLLPVGISFYTFQTLSYSIEVYKGTIKAERHLGYFALYVSFFPQLVAGPIERPQNLLHQFREVKIFNDARVSQGLKYILWGMFMKVVIADRLGIYVDQVYNNIEHHHGVSYLLATYFFAFQIYGDFAGYSLIAIGVARIMGFHLMDNFKTPYFSTSISEFWSRWHISLSTWFKDYLYIPLGGNRTTKLFNYRNLLIVFLVSGLWHGANWTFVVWGGLHGIYLILERILKWKKDHIKHFSEIKFIHIIKVLLIFNLTSLAWVFFRAQNLSDALRILHGIFFDFSISLKQGITAGVPFIELLITLIFTALFIFGDFISRYNNFILNHPNKFIRYSLYYLIIFLIIFFGEYGGEQFIYYQF